ncbi:MAG: NAD-dependent protein deacylase [Bacilli bacterium]|nr:NAD-dependent protein deacylase [Bacilli bacterium]
MRSYIKDANSIAFLGGAGVSTGSGIADFRSPQGIYAIESKYGVPYEEMLSRSYFFAHTETFYDFYWSTMVVPAARPNKAHIALANYQKKHRLTVITQNIDGLDIEAGTQNVLEVHGSTHRYTCLACGAKYTLNDLTPKGVPHCKACGGLIKPDVVLYEEPLDEETLTKAVLAVQRANVLIVGGTSLRVYPIAALPSYFRMGKSVLINAEPTPMDDSFDYVICEDIGETLETLLKD